MKLKILDGSFTIHSFPPGSEPPDQVFRSDFYSISKTSEELSVVCPSSLILNSHKSEDGWSCIKVVGPLDFSLTGVLAGISEPLARTGISIFAISTFDTDHILVKMEKIPGAKKALQQEAYTFLE